MTEPHRIQSAEDQALLAATRERRGQHLARRERVVDGIFAVAFLLAAFALASTGDTGEVDWLVAVAFTAAFAAAGQVEFHTGTGYTSPTQLVFVPMLFAVSPEYVPLLVALGAVLGKAPRVIAGRVSADRWLLGIADSWFSLAPAAIFAVAAPVAPQGADWAVLVAAFMAQGASDALVSSARAWLCLAAPPIKVMREVLWIYRVDALLTPIGLLAAVATVREPYAGLLTLPLVVLFAMFAAERAVRIDKQLELERTYRGTAMLLGDVIEDDDAYTGAHTRGVVGLTMAVARRLGLEEDDLRDCEFGALLHDVGKVRMPKSIINKDGPLDEEEWAIMRTHTIEGQRMLAHVGGALERVGEVVRGSHERWDGNGYPDGLVTDQIPLASRIVSACDAYNAMTTDRPYRRALSADIARAELETCSGSQFDPHVVAALLAVLDAQPGPGVGLLAGVGVGSG